MAGRAGLVTGAAGGIGRACAVRFAAEGASVVVSDLESARAGGEETVAMIREAGGTAEFFPCDVADAAAAEALVAHVVERYGQLDFAHNNAGIGGSNGRLADISDEDFDRIIAVNLRGTFLGMKHQIRAMLGNGGGAIVTPLKMRGTPERALEIRRPQAMSRFGQPEEVAAAVVWLCSPDASFVTGVAMPVDAGSVAGW
jgi:NAD(P)-dependent dehydrogenase (short-subunit alcohol dehydrogenase family)